MLNETTTTKTITETMHDTVFKIEKDSSFYQAYLECQDGKVVTKNVTQSESGRNLKSPKVRIENNLLNVDCESEASELFAQWKSQYIQEMSNSTRQIPVVTNELTFWQELQIRLFWILTAVVAIWIVWQLLKAKFK